MPGSTKKKTTAVADEERLLLQEEVQLLLLREVPRQYAWLQLVVCAMMTCCCRKTVDEVFLRFQKAFRYPQDYLEEHRRYGENEEAFIERLDGICGFRSLGLERRRARTLLYLARWIFSRGAPETREQVLRILGLGKYAADSYGLFVLHSVPKKALQELEDSALRTYILSDRFAAAKGRRAILL